MRDASISTDITFDKFRFHIGDVGSARSGVWVAWHTKNDFYLAAKDAMGLFKVSFHAITNLCHARADAAGAGTYLSKWQREETPEEGGIHVASVIFPEAFSISPRPVWSRKPNRKHVALTPAKSGKAWEFAFFFSNDSSAVAERRLGSDGLFPVLRIDLPRGDFVYVALLEREFDAASELTPPPEGAVHRSHSATVDKDSLRNFSPIHWRLVTGKGPLLIYDSVPV